MADETPERNAATDPNWVGVNDGAPDDTTYDPSNLDATRERQQGLGVGARDLERQRDPSRPAADQPEGDDLTNPETGDVDSAS